MWIAFACLSAFFAGITAILAKCGIQKTDSTVATAIRTIVVLVFAWAMVFVVGSFPQIATIDPKTWTFLVLSGLATGASWLCYFRALQLGDVNKVIPIDKSSTALTLVLAFILLGEPLGWASAAAVALILVGTLLMIERKKTETAPDSADKPNTTAESETTPTGTNSTRSNESNDNEIKQSKAALGNSWPLFAILSAVFASLVAILGKVGIDGVESNLGTAIRTVVVLLMSWGMVFVTGKRSKVHHIEPRELLFICLSGLATGASTTSA